MLLLFTEGGSGGTGGGVDIWLKFGLKPVIAGCRDPMGLFAAALNGTPPPNGLNPKPVGCDIKEEAGYPVG